MQSYIKLSEYANKKSITYRTAWNHFKKGLIEGAYLDETNHVLVPLNNKKSKDCMIYARVSSHDRKDSLLNQQKRLEEFAVAQNYNIVKSYKEIASGMNDTRPILTKILTEDSWNYLIIENKDRLTRFGFNFLKTLLNKQNKEIIVLNTTDDDKQDLMKDMISVIYSFSARMYGLRRKKTNEQIINFLESE